MLSKQKNVTRVDPLGFIEVGLALVPLAAPARDNCQEHRNLAIVGKKRSRLLKVVHRGVVIFLAGIGIKTLSQNCFAEIRLKSESSFSRLPCFFTKVNRCRKSAC